MAGVTWDRLTLQGFGRFDLPVSVSLRPGANVLVAPNEEGKSTLLAGLCAVLFGLDGGESPTGFSEGRFRNWDSGETFRGELAFSVDGARYMIRRDFAGRNVSLLAWDCDGWRRVAGGKHHASARRAAGGFEAALSDLTGVSSRELFESTFYLRQPLPEVDKLDSDVQGLLSGAGGGFDTALKRLEEQLREVTRHSAGLGVTRVDAREDRELEQVSRAIAALETEIERQRTNVDSLERSQRALAAARAEVQAARQALSTAQQLEAAWQKWLGYRDERRSLVEARASLDRAVKQATQAEDERRRGQERMAEFREYSLLPADAGGLLARLRHLRGQQKADEQRRSALASAIALQEEQCAALAAEIQERYASVADRPGLLSDYDRLTGVLRRGAEARERIQALVQAQREAAAALEAGGWDWSPVGDGPQHAVRRLRVEALRLLDRWQALARDNEALAALDAELSSGYAAFGSITPGQLALAGGAAAARSKLRELAAQTQDLLERERDTQAQAQKRGLAWLAGGLVAGGLAGLAIWLLAARPGGPGGLAGLAVALAAAAGAAGRWLGIRSVADSLADHGVDLLPPVPDVTVSAPPEGRAEAVPAGIAGAEPHAAGHAGYMQALAERMEEIAAAQARLEEGLGPVLAPLADPGSAVDEWHETAGQAAALHERIAEGIRGLGLPGVPPGLGSGEAINLLRLTPLPPAGSWLELAALARVTGTAPRSCGELVDWLAELNEHWWTDAVERATSWASLAAQRDSARRELAVLGGDQVDGSPDQGPPGLLASLEAEAAALRKALLPFDETTGREHLIALQQGLAEARERVARQTAELQRDRSELARLDEGLGSLAREQAGLVTELGPLLEAAGGDLEAAGRRLEEAGRTAAALDGAVKHLAGILRGQGVEDALELEAKRVEIDAEIAAVLGKWDALLEQYPVLLPRSAAGDADPAPLQAQMDLLTAKRAAGQARLDQASQEQLSLNAEIARLEGAGPPLNLAQAASELAELREREARLRFEAEAIALAHSELKTAVFDYQNAYREQLAGAASEYFDSLSGGRGRRVVLDEGFRVAVRMPAGATVLPGQLSQGARDQLYVALRLAIADLVAGRVGLPLLFDDPFLTFDEERLLRMRQTIAHVAAGRQVWVMSHRPEFLEWGTEACIERLSEWPAVEAG